jgi:hypothetical protein
MSLDKESIRETLDVDAFFRAELGELRPGSNGNALALCPFHPDNDSQSPAASRGNKGYLGGPSEGG